MQTLRSIIDKLEKSEYVGWHLIVALYLFAFGGSLFVARTGVGASSVLPVWYDVNTTGMVMMVGGVGLALFKKKIMRQIATGVHAPYVVASAIFFDLTGSGQAVVATLLIQIAFLIIIDHQELKHRLAKAGEHGT